MSDSSRFGPMRQVVFVATWVLGVGPLASASSTFSGTGFGASAQALDQYSSQSGSNPASASTTTTIHYTLFPTATSNGPTPASIQATASAYAAAGPATGDGNLLEIRSYGYTNNPGMTVGAYSVSPQTETSATWSGVAATVLAPAGSALPGSIRLEFQATYSPPSSLTSFGIQGPSFAPQQVTLINQFGTGTNLSLVGAGTALQPGEAPVQLNAAGLLQGDFHLDLPLSSSGVSQVFGLSLASDLPVMLSSLNVTNINNMSLALVGMELPDGTSLDAQGYSVSFQSGLPYAPLPVPEPAAWAAWGLVAAVCGLRCRRR